MYTVIDLERVGDHAENLAELAGKLRDGNMKFSEVGVDDLKLMRAAVESSIDSAVAARETGNIDMVRKHSDTRTRLIVLKRKSGISILNVFRNVNAIQRRALFSSIYLRISKECPTMQSILQDM